MKRDLLPLGCLFLVLANFPSLALQAQEAKGKSAAVGQRIDNLKLTDLDGKTISLHDFKDKKAIVVYFLTFDCPVSNSYLADLSEMARNQKDAVFLGVCVSADEPAQLKKHALEFRVGFPVVQDAKLKAARAFQASTTPEAFVLDSQFVVRYRGRVDDTWAARLKKNREVTRHDLRDALAQVLAGKAVSRPATSPIGCPIALGEEKPATTKLTYYKDVLPILQKRCQTCHRPGESAPFSLMTCSQAVTWAADIKEYTRSRAMPPWKPNAGVEMRDQRTMTEEEIATLAAWADGGTPKGNPADAPPAVKFEGGWVLGQPDLILTPKEEFTLGPNGEDHYRVYVFPLNLAEDTFISGYEVRPGNPRAVHHTLHYYDLKGRARKLEERQQSQPRTGNEADFGPGYPSMMIPGFLPDGECGGWAPGTSPHFLPDGVGYFIPKGADFVAQVHYQRTGKVEKDRTQIGLYFARKACKPIQHMIVAGAFLSVPAGDASYKVKGSIWAERDCTLYSVMPHMHLIGKKIKMTMTPPGGQTTTLIGIDDWDFNWQEMYFLKEPIKVKANTRFDIEGVYDNTAKNRNNPFNPPRRIIIGESTTNEMCFGFLGATSDGPGAIGWQLLNGVVTIRWPEALPRVKTMPK